MLGSNPKEKGVDTTFKCANKVPQGEAPERGLFFVPRFSGRGPDVKAAREWHARVAPAGASREGEGEGAGSASREHTQQQSLLYTV